MAVLDLPPWTPEVADVAVHLLARTRLNNGTLAKTFTSGTTPTDVDVQGIINQQTRLMRPRMGQVPAELADSATALVALKCALVVERSYFVEQISTDMSPYKSLMAEYIDAMRDWDLAARGEEPNGRKLASLRVGTEYPSYLVPWA
jgi:hypothetical protein